MTSKSTLPTDSGAASLIEQAYYQPINIQIEAAFAQFDGQPLDLVLGLPASYPTKTKQRYPLVVVLECGVDSASAIELSRLLADTKEVSETIVAAVRFAEPLKGNCLSLAPLLAQLLATKLLPYCHRNYRINPERVMVYGHGRGGAMSLSMMLSGLGGVGQFVASSPALALGSGRLWSAADAAADRGAASKERQVFICSARGELASPVSRERGSDRSAEFFRYLSSLGIPGLSLQYREFQSGSVSDTASAGLADALQRFWATGAEYGKGMTVLGKPWVNRLCRLFGPLLKTALKPTPVDCPKTGLLMKATALNRQFEIFIDLPPSYMSSGQQSYPLVLVLDANYSYGVARQTIRLMAEHGELDEAIVVGLGIPRREGNIAFALRRLEEFAPPMDKYQFDDALGRMLGSIYALYGFDIRQHWGGAASLHDFVVRQLLPMLHSSLRVDQSRQILFGHSAGGAFAAYELVQPDSPFYGLICSSPGLALSGSWLLQQTEAGQFSGRRRHVVLGIGGREFDNAFNQAAGIPGTPQFAETLSSHEGLSCSFFNLEQEGHSSVFVRTLARGLAATLGPSTRPERGGANPGSERLP